MALSIMKTVCGVQVHTSTIKLILQEISQMISNFLNSIIHKFTCCKPSPEKYHHQATRRRYAYRVKELRSAPSKPVASAPTGGGGKPPHPNGVFLINSFFVFFGKGLGVVLFSFGFSRVSKVFLDSLKAYIKWFWVGIWGLSGGLGGGGQWILVVVFCLKVGFSMFFVPL